MSNSRRLGWFGQPSGAGGPSSGQPQGNIASSSSVARIPPPRLPTLLKLDLCLSPEDPRERRVYHPFSGVFHYQYGISRNARDWVLNNRYVQIWVGFTSLEPLYLRMEWLKRHPDWLRRHPPPRGFHQNMSVMHIQTFSPDRGYGYGDMVTTLERMESKWYRYPHLTSGRSSQDFLSWLPEYLADLGLVINKIVCFGEPFARIIHGEQTTAQLERLTFIGKIARELANAQPDLGQIVVCTHYCECFQRQLASDGRVVWLDAESGQTGASRTREEYIDDKTLVIDGTWNLAHLQQIRNSDIVTAAIMRFAAHWMETPNTSCPPAPPPNQDEQFFWNKYESYMASGGVWELRDDDLPERARIPWSASQVRVILPPPTS